MQPTHVVPLTESPASPIDATQWTAFLPPDAMGKALATTVLTEAVRDPGLVLHALDTGWRKPTKYIVKAPLPSATSPWELGSQHRRRHRRLAPNVVTAILPVLTLMERQEMLDDRQRLAADTTTQTFVGTVKQLRKSQLEVTKLRRTERKEARIVRELQTTLETWRRVHAEAQDAVTKIQDELPRHQALWQRCAADANQLEADVNLVSSHLTRQATDLLRRRIGIDLEASVHPSPSAGVSTEEEVVEPGVVTQVGAIVTIPPRDIRPPLTAPDASVVDQYLPEARARDGRRQQHRLRKIQRQSGKTPRADLVPVGPKVKVWEELAQTMIEIRNDPTLIPPELGLPDGGDDRVSGNVDSGWWDRFKDFYENQVATCWRLRDHEMARRYLSEWHHHCDQHDDDDDGDYYNSSGDDDDDDDNEEVDPELSRQDMRGLDPPSADTLQHATSETDPDSDTNQDLASQLSRRIDQMYTNLHALLAADRFRDPAVAAAVRRMVQVPPEACDLDQLLHVMTLASPAAAGGDGDGEGEGDSESHSEDSRDGVDTPTRVSATPAVLAPALSPQDAPVPPSPRRRRPRQRQSADEVVRAPRDFLTIGERLSAPDVHPADAEALHLMLGAYMTIAGTGDPARRDQLAARYDAVSTRLGHLIAFLQAPLNAAYLLGGGKGAAAPWRRNLRDPPEVRTARYGTVHSLRSFLRRRTKASLEEVIGLPSARVSLISNYIHVDSWVPDFRLCDLVTARALARDDPARPSIADPCDYTMGGWVCLRCVCWLSARHGDCACRCFRGHTRTECARPNSGCYGFHPSRYMEYMALGLPGYHHDNNGKGHKNATARRIWKDQQRWRIWRDLMKRIVAGEIPCVWTVPAVERSPDYDGLVTDMTPLVREWLTIQGTERERQGDPHTGEARSACLGQNHLDMMLDPTRYLPAYRNKANPYAASGPRWEWVSLLCPLCAMPMRLNKNEVARGLCSGCRAWLPLIEHENDLIDADPRYRVFWKKKRPRDGPRTTSKRKRPAATTPTSSAPTSEPAPLPTTPTPPPLRDSFGALLGWLLPPLGEPQAPQTASSVGGGVLDLWQLPSALPQSTDPILGTGAAALPLPSPAKRRRHTDPTPPVPFGHTTTTLQTITRLWGLDG